jgi:hypothetical protein
MSPFKLVSFVKFSYGFEASKGFSPKGLQIKSLQTLCYF